MLYMPKTEKEIIRLINLAKPDYSNVINRLTDEDYPMLEKLIKGDDIYLALDVISCVGFLKTERSLTGLEIAVKSGNREVRILAAHVLRQLTNFQKAVDLINELLGDPDLGVRKFALKTANFAKLVTLKVRVQEVSDVESNQRMKIFSSIIKDNLDRFDDSDIVIR